MAVQSGLNNISGEIRKLPHNQNYTLLIENDQYLEGELSAKLDTSVFNQHYIGTSFRHESNTINYSGSVPSVNNVEDAIDSNRSLILTNYSTLSSNINANYNDLNTKINTVDDRVDNIITDSGTSSTEVVDARFDNNWAVGYATLSERLDNMKQFTDGITDYKYRLAHDGERMTIEIEEVI